MFKISFEFTVEHSDRGARMGEICIGRKIIETPISGLNHVENKHLRRGEGILQTVNRQPAPFLEVVYDLPIKRNLRLDRNLLNTITQSMRRKSRRDTPTITMFRVSKDFSNDILEFLVNIQIQANSSEIITIPDPILRDYSQYWRTSMNNGLNLARNNLETGRNVEIMPVISLNQDKKVLTQKVISSN